MHIPDGFVSAPVAVATSVISAAGAGYAVWHTNRFLPSHRQALLGLSAAFVFAAQMVNFPVLHGTSGHLVGGALLAALLGLGPSIVAITAVLIVQCLMFADGGVTALGANCLNMAMIGVVSSYAVYRLGTAILGMGRVAVMVSAGLAGWVSTVLAAVACAGEIALSGKAPAGVIVPAMLFSHVLIGIGEGVITALVLASILQIRPSLVTGEVERSGWRSTLVYGSLAAVGVAVFISPFACPWPDGLERVASALGFESSAIQPMVCGLMPDYQLPQLGAGGLSTAVSGAIGTILVLTLGCLLARLISQRKAAEPVTEPVTIPSRRPNSGQ